MCCENSVSFSNLDPILDKYSGTKGSLITILQKAQDIYGYLSPELIKYIAARTGIKPAKIMGVVTFYTQFRLEPVGKYLIQLCQGTACHVNGSKAIEEAILSHLSTAPEGLFTLQNVACLGCCSLAPVMMINGETYGTLTPETTRKILQEIRESEAIK